MTHCGDKWERMFEADPEACEMVEDYRRKVQKHLATLKKIRARGITVTVKTFPEGAHRELPKEDDDIYPDALDYVCHCLERGEKVTAGDLKSTVKAYREKACPSCAIAKNNTNVLSAPTNTDEKPTSSGEVLADRLKDKPHGSSAFHTAAQELVAKKNGIAGEMFPDGNYSEIPDSSIPAWTPALCKTGPCPDGRSHTTHDKVRGIVCEQTGQPINQISKCPIIIRMTAAEAGGFVPEGQPRPITNEYRPLRIVKTPLTDEEKQALADSFFERTNKPPGEIQQADELVSARYEGVKSRYELIDKAWSWFLAQAGGE